MSLHGILDTAHIVAGVLKSDVGDGQAGTQTVTTGQEVCERLQCLLSVVEETQQVKNSSAIHLPSLIFYSVFWHVTRSVQCIYWFTKRPSHTYLNTVLYCKQCVVFCICKRTVENLPTSSRGYSHIKKTISAPFTVQFTISCSPSFTTVLEAVMDASMLCGTGNQF